MKRKILFLIESLAGGGAEKVLTTLVQHIDRAKFEVSVCAISGGGMYEHEVEAVANYHSVLNAPEHYHGLMKLWYNFKYHLIYSWMPMSWIYRLFIPKGADVEVAFVEGFATKLIASSTNRTAKKVAWVHCDLERDHWTRKIFKNNEREYSVYKKYCQIVTMSETQKQSLNKIFPGLDVKVCYNPIDSLQIIALSKQNVSREYEERNRMRFVSVGRLVPVKAYDCLLRVVNRLIEDNYNIELWLLGEGPERQLLEQYVEAKNIHDYVKFIGFQSNPYKFIVRCDLFVCSSVSEGFSTAITEALILGVPVISTEVSGVREQLKNGCGIITENSEDALYHGLKRVLDNPEKLSEMRERTIERSMDFDIDYLMKGIESVL